MADAFARADVLGRPIERMANLDAGLVGAAVLALEDAVGRMARSDRGEALACSRRI